MSPSSLLTHADLPSQREPALFVAPPGFHPNAIFFGMEKELEELHRRLFKAKARAERTMAVLIAGVPDLERHTLHGSTSLRSANAIRVEYSGLMQSLASQHTSASGRLRRPPPSWTIKRPKTPTTKSPAHT